MAEIKIYEVGGCVRDEIMGLPASDVDFAIEAESYAEMRDYLVSNGFEIFVETPGYFTIRARPPKNSALYQRTRGADFVLCRSDSPGSDGRRPDYVEIGTIYDDLARRDFTMNAIAKNIETGEIIDPHGGQADINLGLIRFVGNPRTRIEEDALRVVRALRFSVTKGLEMSHLTRAAIESPEAADWLHHKVSIERIDQELRKMFRFNTILSIGLIADLGYDLQEAIFRDGLHLDSSLKDV